jgi:hypothetical protein
MSMKSTSRRDFLCQSAASAAGAVAMGVLPQFGMLNSALAQSTVSGYKALVCLYMSGGNDSFNMLIPTNPARHAEYVTARGGIFTGNAAALGIPRIGGLTPAGSLPAALPLAGVEFGLNPACTGMQNLYNQGRLAFISNVAPLVEPVTRATIDTRRLPPQLYSHTDQTLLWNIGNSASSTSTEGWGGLVAGRINATSSLAGLPPSISVAGQPRFLVGNRPSTGAPIKPYNISTSSSKPAPTPNGLSATSTANFESLRRQTVNQLLAAASPNALTNEYGDILERSYLVGASINALIGTGGIYNPLPAGMVFPVKTVHLCRLIGRFTTSISAAGTATAGKFHLHRLTLRACGMGIRACCKTYPIALKLFIAPWRRCKCTTKSYCFPLAILAARSVQTAMAPITAGAARSLLSAAAKATTPRLPTIPAAAPYWRATRKPEPATACTGASRAFRAIKAIPLRFPMRKKANASPAVATYRRLHLSKCQPRWHAGWAWMMPIFR